MTFDTNHRRRMKAPFDPFRAAAGQLTNRYSKLKVIWTLNPNEQGVALTSIIRDHSIHLSRRSRAAATFNLATECIP